VSNSKPEENTESQSLEAKYNVTGWFYDILDYPWERQYRKWRPELLGDLSGRVLEAGVGTGRNLAHYPPDLDVIGIDLSARMLAKATKRARHASCRVTLAQDDATALSTIEDGSMDWVVSTFMCCVMPNKLQPMAVAQFARVLKPGGRFRLLEMVYSESPELRKRQERFAPFVERVYGARFDRETQRYIEENPDLDITSTRFLKADTYLLLEGVRK
jgi:ubiquinone/menaquinone biosynthesis C-methylase UbiE